MSATATLRIRNPDSTPDDRLAQVAEYIPAQTERLRLLEVLEQRIDDAREAVLRAAVALVEIQERKLYRDAGFKTFHEYTSRRLRISRTRAYQLLDWARLRKQIPVENEYQARRIALAWRKSPEGVGEAFEALVGQGVPPTEAVRELARNPAEHKRRSRSVATAELCDEDHVFVVVGLPTGGNEAPTIKAAARRSRALELRNELDRTGRYRKVIWQLCEVEPA